MSGVLRSQSDLMTELPDNTSGLIEPQDIRDVVATALGSYVTTQTTSYTLVLADAGTTIHMNSASGNNLTVPPNASVAFATGTVIGIRQIGAGQTSLVQGSGVTINSSSGTLTLRARYSMVTLTFGGSNVWYADGDLT